MGASLASSVLAAAADIAVVTAASWCWFGCGRLSPSTSTVELGGERKAWNARWMGDADGTFVRVFSCPGTDQEEDELV